ncbi:MAG: lysylphosphatidylglycerol synthase transmembrane domain-containing protein, partial [Promethearchaeota archaeon]
LGFLTFAIIIFMIYYIGPANFINNFAKLKLANLIFYYAVLYITIIFRIIDWKVILKGMDSNASYSTLYSSTGICIMVNEFVPLKLGDLIRIRIVKKREKSLSYGTIISSLTVFRVLDLIFMSLFAFLGFLTLSIFYSKVFMTDDNILNFGNGLQGVSNSPAGDSLLFNIRYILLGGLIISGLVIGIIILLITKTELILKITEKVSHKLRNALQKILLPFKKGILDLIKNKKLLFWALFIEGTTILIDATLLYIILPSFNLDVFILIAIISSLFTFLATVIPFTPGGWGIAELLGAGILKLFYPSYSMELLLSIILIEHFLRTFATIVIGASSYIVMNLKTEN